MAPLGCRRGIAAAAIALVQVSELILSLSLSLSLSGVQRALARGCCVALRRRRWGRVLSYLRGSSTTNFSAQGRLDLIRHQAAPSCVAPVVSHSFTDIYGAPLAKAEYHPPADGVVLCSLVALSFSVAVAVAVAGEQYAQLAAVWLNGVALPCTTATESTPDGVCWAVRTDETRHSPLMLGVLVLKAKSEQAKSEPAAKDVYGRVEPGVKELYLRCEPILVLDQGLVAASSTANLVPCNINALFIMPSTKEFQICSSYEEALQLGVKGARLAKECPDLLRMATINVICRGSHFTTVQFWGVRLVFEEMPQGQFVSAVCKLGWYVCFMSGHGNWIWKPPWLLLNFCHGTDCNFMEFGIIMLATRGSTSTLLLMRFARAGVKLQPISWYVLQHFVLNAGIVIFIHGYKIWIVQQFKYAGNSIKTGIFQIAYTSCCGILFQGLKVKATSALMVCMKNQQLSWVHDGLLELLNCIGIVIGDLFFLSKEQLVHFLIDASPCSASRVFSIQVSVASNGALSHTHNAIMQQVKNLAWGIYGSWWNLYVLMKCKIIKEIRLHMSTTVQMKFLLTSSLLFNPGTSMSFECGRYPGSAAVIFRADEIYIQSSRVELNVSWVLLACKLSDGEANVADELQAVGVPYAYRQMVKDHVMEIQVLIMWAVFCQLSSCGFILSLCNSVSGCLIFMSVPISPSHNIGYGVSVMHEGSIDGMHSSWNCTMKQLMRPLGGKPDVKEGGMSRPSYCPMLEAAQDEVNEPSTAQGPLEARLHTKGAQQLAKGKKTEQNLCLRLPPASASLFSFLLCNP